MQQPFNQPGGSQGNAPYAAPPPKRGFNWLFCCLGCLGLGVIIVVILGLVAANKMKQASGPPITAATYRQEFPAGVPIYPGLTFDEQTTAPMRYAGGAFGLVPKSGVKMRMMAFKSTQGVDVIGPWYKAQLTPKGWRVAGTSTSERASSWQFEKDNTTFMISDNGRKQGFIMVMVSHGLRSRNGVKFNPR